MLTTFTISAQQPYCNGSTTTTDPAVTGGFDWRVNPLNNGNVFVGPQGFQFPAIQYPYTGASTNPNLDIPATPFLKDYKPEDGWELLYYDVGSPSVGTDDPVVFLYNKYRSIMRVFILLLNEEGDGNKAIVVLEWEKNGNDRIGSAYLSAYNSPMDALDNFNKHERRVQMLKPNHYVNGDAQWLFADFPIVYDPCICQNTSYLAVRSSVILEGDIFLKVNNRQVANSQIVQNGYTQTSSDWFDASFGGLENFPFKDTKVIKENFHLLKIGDDQDMQNKTLGGTVKNLKDAGIVSTSVGWIKAISSAIKILDYFVAGGSKSSLAEKDVPSAMMIPASVAIGTISYDKPYSYNKFVSPGANTDGVSPDLIPTYQNPLGIINLLETPELEYIAYGMLTSNTAVSYYLINTPSGSGRLVDYRPRVRQYRLKKDIKYVVNPSSGLEVVSIEGAFVYRTGGTWQTASTVTTNNNVGYAYTTKGSLINWNTPVGPVTTKPIDYVNYEESLYEDNIEISLWKQADQLYSDSLYYKTPYSPLGCMKNNQFRIYENNLYSDTELPQNNPNIYRYGITNDPEIYFRVRAILERKDGEGEPVIFIASYNVATPTKISGEFSCDLYLNDKHVTDISQLIGNSQSSYNFHAINFSNGNDPTWSNMLDNSKDVFSMASPNTYGSGNYFAKQEVNLNGTASQTLMIPGNTTITAGNKINVGKYVKISPDATLKIGHHPGGYGCEQLKQPEGFEVISDFCNDKNKYKPNYYKSGDPFTENTISEEQNLSVWVSPNPAQSYVNITFDQLLEKNVEIWVTDLTGRTVSPMRTVNNLWKTQLSVDGLANGLYLINISSSGIVQTKKIMVSH